MKDSFNEYMKIGRLPYNLVVERVILGLIIEGSNPMVDKVKSLIKRSFFFARSHRAIYQAIFYLYDNNKTIDWMSITFYLVIDTQTSFIIVYNLLKSVREEFARAEHRLALKSNDGAWLFLVATLAEYEAKRNHLKALSGTKSKINDSSISFRKQLNVLQESVKNLTYGLPYSSNRVETWGKDIKHCLNSFINELERKLRFEQIDEFLPTGFHQLDQLIGGFRRRDLIVVGGRPGVGKTITGLNLASKILQLRTDVTVLFFSSEMPLKDILVRFMIMHSTQDLSFFDLLSGNLNLEKLSTEQENLGWADKLINLYVEDSFQIELSELRRISVVFKEQHPNLGLIVIDYLQIIRASQETDPSTKLLQNMRSLQVAQIVESLKLLARQLNVPVVLLSQLSRNAESRPGKTQMLSDLSESGFIEQQADVVILISQQQKISGFMTPPPQHKSVVVPFNLTVAKNRNGPTGEIHLGLYVKKMMLVSIKSSLSGFN
uniref:DNA 5'-3' helicase n=1 Tax=Cyanidium caldarium TaxID=2771 RepID=Q9TM03_CYACA|nr:replication helicase subunit [Cyanidium caldarium]AAF12980.1 unknown [Cyanidium caldarium]WDB00239.1 replication helicase subunit [Cyanidium caldarium]